MSNLKKNISIIFLFFLIINGCADNPVSIDNVSLNSDFKIKYGQSVYIPDENLFIAFQDVVEESRCPEGMECFWQGTAKIKLFIRQGNDTMTDTVETYLPQSIVKIGQINNSYLFDVKDVEPYPQQNLKVDVHNYILTLNVSHFTYGFSDSEIDNKTGIYGQVYITGGPIIRRGYIDFHPFKTAFLIVNSRSDTNTVQTDSTGRFLEYTDPGEYKIVQQTRFPILNDTTIYKVANNKMTYINLKYFSGLK